MFRQYLAELSMAYSGNGIPQGSEKESTAAEYTDANIPTWMNLCWEKQAIDY